MDLEVLFEDNHLLVINKPAGLLAQGDRTGDQTVLDLGKDYLKRKYNKPGNVFLALVHRLDRPVSGVMVLARTSKAAHRLTEQFKNRIPQKRYLAIVESECDGEGYCVDYLIKERERVRIVNASYPKAKRAELSWQAIDSRKEWSLLDIHLITGRPHQIRVQFSHRGWPLLGDYRYGAQRSFDGRNLALHSYNLAIEHPIKREVMTYTVAPSSSWSDVFRPAIEETIERHQAFMR